MLAPQLLIGTRFGLQIRDPAWFEHRIALFSAVTVPSLMRQTDQSFHWALLVDPDLPNKTRRILEDTLAPFEGRAFLHTQRGQISVSLLALAKMRGLIDDDGYILTGRIDDDDAWRTTTVGQVRQRVARWLDEDTDHRGLAMTFADGLVWLMYDMEDVDRARRRGEAVTHRAGVRPYRSPFTSMSGFVCSSFADGMTSYASKHSGLPSLLRHRNFLVEISTTAEPMWLYTRHKQATGNPNKGNAMTEMNASINSLAERFGIDAERTRGYIADSDAFGYRRFNPLKRRGAYRTLLLQLEREMELTREAGRSTAQLEHQRAHLRNKRLQEMENVTSLPDHDRPM